MFVRRFPQHTSIHLVMNDLGSSLFRGDRWGIWDRRTDRQGTDSFSPKHPCLCDLMGGKEEEEGERMPLCAPKNHKRRPPPFPLYVRSRGTLIFCQRRRAGREGKGQAFGIFCAVSFSPLSFSLSAFCPSPFPSPFV